MSRVSLLNVSKTYGDFQAVATLSLEIEEGTLVAVLGPSGCGKTTTLRMIAGFVAATTGRILFGDRDVTAIPPNGRNTGMVFQGYALFPHMTVTQNVAYGLEMRKVPRGEIARRVQEALSLVRLTDFADRLPRQLSGGQQQRVALARALVIRPDVLLLDEPLSSLDANLRHDMRNEIRRLQQALALTTVFVTHDQEEALSIADCVVVMNKGRVEQVGKPAEIYERPKTAFVAGFIGKSNFFEGHREDGVFVTRFGSFVLAESAKANATSRLFAVRPEKMSIRPTTGEPWPMNTVAGSIETVSYLGPVTEYQVRIDGQQTVQVHCQNRRSESDGELAVGAMVQVGWHAEACVVL